MPRKILYATPEEKRKAACERSKRWRERNLEVVKAKKKIYNANNKEKISAYNKAYAEANADSIRAKDEAWRAANVEHRRERERRRYEANKDHFWQKLAKWRAENPNKVLESNRRRSSGFKTRNRQIYTASQNKRRAIKLGATPAWADHKAIEQYYLIANYLSFELGVDFHVDHVVPLQSDRVCGLHAQTNMNIALGSWNISKSNRWWPDMPEPEQLAIAA